MEIWRKVYIEPYNQVYEISNLGNLRKKNDKVYKYLKLQKSKDDKGRNRYKKIYMSYMGEGKNILIHQLVASTFLNKSEFKYYDEEDRLKHINKLNKLEINHKDENGFNNNVDNLEWCTHKYNINYGNRSKKVSEANKGKHPSLETRKKNE